MAAPGQQYFTANPFEVDTKGVPAAAYQLFFYQSGTSTPQNVYADPQLTTPLANPVVADANGRFGAIWLANSPAYKVQLWTPVTAENPTGAQVWSEDPVGPGAAGSIANTAGIVGEVRQFAGPAASIPTGWYACFGQAVSRTTYATLFSLIGTTWGSGDGSTTFNMPDLRGRAMFGLDNMGGSPADRVTSGVSGIAGTTLGGTGGDQHAQQDTLTSDSTSTVTDPGHVHGTYALDGTPSAPAGTNQHLVISTGGTTDSAVTGVTVATTTTTTSGLTGASQNMPPAAMVISMIFAGA